MGCSAHRAGVRHAALGLAGMMRRAAGAMLLMAVVLAAEPYGGWAKWQHKMTAVTRKIGRLGIAYDFDQCAKRSSTPGRFVTPDAQLGIIVVLCWETLEFYDQIGCRDGLLHYHVYSKCGVTEEAFIAAAPNIAKCASFKMVVSTVYTELSWAKAHSEFLEHIITRYHQLERTLIFTKAKVARASMRHVVDLAGAVDEALTGEWAYKPLWPTKFSVRFSECPMTCNAEQFGRELCAIYKRYTCESGCFSCDWDNEWLDVPRLTQVRTTLVSRCYFPNPRSTFIAAASRIRSLPITEYMWLREWIQSWQEGSGGVFRRLIGERLWPVLLGCPEDIHHNTSDGGCTHDMKFPQGSRIQPPDEMIEDGLLHTYLPGHSALVGPMDSYANPHRHTSKHPYPHILSPKYGESRKITFAAVYAPAQVHLDVLMLLQSAFASVLQFHPSARFILLVEANLTSTLMATLMPDLGWFVGRLEFVSLEATAPPEAGTHRTPEQLAGDLWPEAHWLEFSMKFLTGHVMAARDPSREFGHVVLMGLTTLVLDNLWPVFEGKEFAAALTAMPVMGHMLGSQPIMLHKDRLAESGRILSDLWQSASTRGGSFPSTLREELLHCLTDDELLQAGRGAALADPIPTVSCGGQQGIDIKLLPCKMWSAVHQLQTFESPRGGNDWPELDVCAPDYNHSAMARIFPPDGERAWMVIQRMREYAEPALGRTYLQEL